MFWVLLMSRRFKLSNCYRCFNLGYFGLGYFGLLVFWPWIFWTLVFWSWVFWPWVFWDFGYFGTLGILGLWVFWPWVFQDFTYFGFGYFGVEPFSFAHSTACFTIGMFNGCNRIFDIVDKLNITKRFFERWQDKIPKEITWVQNTQSQNGVRTFRPVPFQPLQFQPLQLSTNQLITVTKCN